MNQCKDLQQAVRKMTQDKLKVDLFLLSNKGPIILIINLNQVQAVDRDGLLSEIQIEI
jgi:hypothetical protein